MRDLAFIAFLLGLWGLGLRRPFLFICSYVYIDIVSPQRLTYYLLNSVPISLIAVALAVGGWLLADDKRDSRFTVRQALILILLLYCWGTTQTADFPVEAADKWQWVWKNLAFAAFLPLTLRTRLRIEALLVFVTLSAATIIIVGGIKTLASGGGYGELNLMVDNNSGLYESSIISTVAIALIPIILWLVRDGTLFTPDWRMKTFAYALCFACLLMPVGTSARTGLLCIALLAILSLRTVKRRMLYLGALVAAGLIAMPLLPSSFSERMGTIKTYQADESASTRLAVWRWTWDYAKAHPFGGGFSAYIQNRIRYDTPTFFGFKAAASIIDKHNYDVALWYKGKIAGTELAGAAGFCHTEGAESAGDGACWGNGTTINGITQFNGSVSVLTPIGLIWRLIGRDPLVRKRSSWTGWTTYPERYSDRSHFTRMY